MNKADVMLAYVPKFMQQAKAYRAIIDAEGPEFNLLQTSIEDILKQFYVETATEWGLDLWEQMLGLKSYAGKPLDQRRSRIISKLRGIGTVTVQLIKSVAEAYDGGTVDVTEQPELYQFTVEFIDTRGIPPNLDDLKAAIGEIKPAHLSVVYIFRYLIWDELDTESITWDQQDVLALSWDDYETGGWLNA